MKLIKLKDKLLSYANKEADIFLKEFLEYMANTIEAMPAPVTKNYISNTTKVHVRTLKNTGAKEKGLNSIIKKVDCSQEKDLFLWLNKEFKNWMGIVIFRLRDSEILGVAFVELNRNNRPKIPKSWDGREETLINFNKE